MDHDNRRRQGAAPQRRRVLARSCAAAVIATAIAVLSACALNQTDLLDDAIEEAIPHVGMLYEYLSSRRNGVQRSVLQNDIISAIESRYPLAQSARVRPMGVTLVVRYPTEIFSMDQDETLFEANVDHGEISGQFNIEWSIGIADDLVMAEIAPSVGITMARFVYSDIDRPIVEIVVTFDLELTGGPDLYPRRTTRVIVARYSYGFGGWERVGVQLLDSGTAT